MKVTSVGLWEKEQVIDFGTRNSQTLDEVIYYLVDLHNRNNFLDVKFDGDMFGDYVIAVPKNEFSLNNSSTSIEYIRGYEVHKNFEGDSGQSFTIERLDIVGSKFKKLASYIRQEYSM